ncbi:MAG: hypothetical protein HUK20_01495 [Fibrobacter sp.]|nr:hypothetical protein [Fibrobacter sp.]
MDQAKWYALWVSTGDELETVRELNRKGARCSWIYPTYVQRKKYGGQWHDVVKPMFPGYVFFTGNSVGLGQAITAATKFARILTDGKEPMPLAPTEVEFIKKVTVAKQGEEFAAGDVNSPEVISLSAECSYGFIENDQVIVTRGPLRNQEACIKKIDRHKRLATVEISMLGRPMTVDLSLEIVYKK